jgi:hypothetical protein
MLEEDVPEGVEFIDQHADDGEQTTDDTSDDEQMEEDETDATDDVSEDADPTDEEDLIDEGDQLDQGEAVDEFEDLVDAEDAVDDQMDDADDQELVDDEDVGEIKNLTLVTYPCPVNWNPATREIADSHQVCTVPPVPAMSYTILYEGEMMVEVAVQTDADLDKDLRANGIPLKAGMWTIQEKQQEGLADPFAFCAIYAADGNMRMLVQEFAPGGKMDFLLAEGEELNCEWFSVAEVPEVTGDPNALPLGGLRVAVFSCPAGFNPAVEPYIVAHDTCVYDRAPVFTYEAYRNNELVSTKTDNGNLDTVDFQEGLDTRLLSGSYRIHGSIPSGYLEPYVTCAIAPEGTTNYADVPVAPVSGTVELEVAPGADAVCQWFNLEAAPRPEQSRGINVVVYTCPSDFSTELASKAEAQAACTLPMPAPVTFEFIQNGVVLATGTSLSQTDYISVSQSGALPNAGVWTFRILQPPGSGLSKGFCEGSDTTGAVTSATTMTAFDDDADITIAPNELVNCSWFTVPGARTDIIRVTAHNCPAGFNPADPTAGDKFATCPVAADVEFDIQVEGASILKATTGANGIVGTNVVPGANRIVQTPQPGFGKPFVLCDLTAAGTAQVQTIEAPIGTDQRSVTFELDAGDRLTCDWFAVPGELELPAPAIEITAYLCPATVDLAAATTDILFAECDAAAAGAGFAVSDGDDEIDSETTGDDGRLGFIELPVGDDGTATYTLALNGDPDAVRVLCKNNPFGGEGPAFDARVSEDHAIVQQMKPGDTLVCEWFIVGELAGGIAGNNNGNGEDDEGDDNGDEGNDGGEEEEAPAAAGGNTLTIQAHLCPETAQPDDDYGTLLLTCGMVHNGVQIGLAQEGRTTEESEAAPLATWSNIAEGTATLAWVAEEPGSEVVLYCSSRWTDADDMVNDQFPEEQPVTDGSITLTFDHANMQMFCDWFTFPAGEAQSPAAPSVLDVA